MSTFERILPDTRIFDGREEGPIREQLKQILPRLRLYAQSRTQAPADADDLVSETCVKLLETEERFQKGADLMPLAVRVLRNLHIDRIRAERPHLRVVLADGMNECETDPNAHQSVEDHLALSEVHQLIHTLPEEQREVLVLRGGGLCYDEIARSLEIPRGTVMSRLARGRKALAELLADEDEGKVSP